MCSTNRARGYFLKTMFYILELLHIDTDVRQCIFGDCIGLMYCLVVLNDYEHLFDWIVVRLCETKCF